MARTFDKRRFSGPIGELVAKSQARVLANMVGRIQDRADARRRHRHRPRRASAGARRREGDGGRRLGGDARHRPAARRRAALRRSGSSAATRTRSISPTAASTRSSACGADAHAAVEALRRRAVPRRRAARHRRLSVGDERRAVRVAGAARHARARASRPSRTGSSPHRAIADAFDRNGFRIRSVHRQFVLPIALHKAIGSRRFTLWSPNACSIAPACSSRSARRSRSSPNGARPRNRRDGVHRRPSRPRARGARATTVSRARARPRAPAASALARAGIDAGDRRPARSRRRWPPRPAASTSSITSPRFTGRPASATTSTAPSTRPRSATSSRRRRAAGVRRVVHCSTVGVHGDVEHPPANEDAPLKPGDIYQDTKLEGERLAREAGARLGIEVTIVRPTGIYGPGDRRLLKLFRGVARRRWVTLGSGEIYYHLTYIDDLVDGFRLCGEHPAAANRTYILAGGEVTTLNELVALVADVAGVPPPTPAPAGLAVLDGRRGVRGDLRAVRHRAADLSPARRLLHEEPRVRHHARAHGDRLRAARRAARRHPPHAGLVSRARMAVIMTNGPRAIARRRSSSSRPARRAARSTRRSSSAARASARC